MQGWYGIPHLGRLKISWEGVDNLVTPSSLNGVLLRGVIVWVRHPQDNGGEPGVCMRGGVS